MEPILALLVGVLTAAAVWLMLARQLLKFVFGLVLLGNGANLALFAAGRQASSNPPFIPEGATEPVGAVANALPQALILTAIVIGFALLAFALALILRAWRDTGCLDVDGIGNALSEHDRDPLREKEPSA